MAERADLRASDADRENIAQRLRQATAEGRLGADELEERLHSAFSAKTYGELDGLVADLPSATPPAAPAFTPYLPAQRTNGMAIASLVVGIFWMWGLGSLLAVVFGLLARREIKRSEGRQTGQGLATAGITVGSIGLVGAATLIIITLVSALARHAGVG